MQGVLEYGSEEAPFFTTSASQQDTGDSNSQDLNRNAFGSMVGSFPLSLNQVGGWVGGLQGMGDRALPAVVCGSIAVVLQG
jgi:hypothetical protein